MDLLKLDRDKSVFKMARMYHSKICLITKPTRVTSTSATIIDHIWSNNLRNIFNGIIYDAGTVSDHFPTISFFYFQNNEYTSELPSSPSFRNYSDENREI